MNKESRRDFFKFFGLFICLVFLDQLSKWGFRHVSHGVMNRGLIFGTYAGIPPFIRVSLISSIFGIVFFLYMVALYFLPARNNRVKYALTFITGGIAGNVYSKVVIGASYDFILIDIFSKKILFNLADVFQWLGIIFLLYLAIFLKSLWYTDNKRGSFLVSRKEQYVFSLKLCSISFSSSLFLGLFNYTFIKSILSEKQFFSIKEHMLLYVITFVAISLIFMGVVFLVGIMLSHRFTGPLMGFGRYVQSLLDGNTKSFKLRKSDYFKDLEPLSDKLLERINKN